MNISNSNFITFNIFRIANSNYITFAIINMTNFLFHNSKHIRIFLIKSGSNVSNRDVEVGCERFFGLSGYISSPRRTRLKVRTYERLTMLAFMCIMYTSTLSGWQRNTSGGARQGHGRKRTQWKISSAGTWSATLMLRRMGSQCQSP